MNLFGIEIHMPLFKNAVSRRPSILEEKSPARSVHNGGRCAAFQYVLHSTSRPILKTDAAMTLHCSKTLIAGDEGGGGRSV